jgi:predicted hotdog family 3-hydroxylacyl-ACP dehydratase
VLTPPLDRGAIARLVPHGGAMCLLDRALFWDADSIVCEADRHRDPANPLRRDGRLPAVCGVEYALQAMALHGALLASGAAQPAGYLSSLRDVSLGGASGSTPWPARSASARAPLRRKRAASSTASRWRAEGAPC